MTRRLRLFLVLFVTALVLSASALALASPKEMSRDAIIKLAKSGMGYS